MQVLTKYTKFRETKGFIFLSHVAKGFQLTQMVYGRFTINIPVLQKGAYFQNMHEFHG